MVIIITTMVTMIITMVMMGIIMDTMGMTIMHITTIELRIGRGNARTVSSMLEKFQK